MILIIALVIFVVQPTVGGIAMGVQQDTHCRKLHKMTRIRGMLLEVYCEPEEKMTLLTEESHQ